jgi:hypothetical protein
MATDNRPCTSTTNGEGFRNPLKARFHYLIILAIPLLYSGCAQKEVPVEIIANRNLIGSEKCDIEGFLSSMRFVPNTQRLGRKEMTNLDYILLQSDTLARDIEKKEVRIKKEWPLYAALQLTLGDGQEWQSYMRELGDGKELEIIRVSAIIHSEYLK